MTTLHAEAQPALAAEVPRTLNLGIAVDGQGGFGGPLRVPLSVLTGQVLVTGAAGEVSHVIARLLAELTAAGVPWLRVGRLPAQVRNTAGGIPATVVDLSDPHGIPLTVNPLQPAAGYPATAHASALCALLQAAFGFPDSVRDVLALALRRVYAPGMAAAAGGAEAAGTDEGAAVPTVRQLEGAVVAAARELGHDGAMEAKLRGIVRARLGGLCGPATGLLLGGGHPVNITGLLSRNVDVVTGDVDGAEGRALVAGAVALRVTEHACQTPRAAPGLPRHVLVIEESGLLLGGSRAAQQVGRLLGDAAVHGTGIIVTEHTPMAVAPWLAGNAALTIAHEPGAVVVAGPALGSPVTISVPPVLGGPGPSPGQHASVDGLIGRRSAGCARCCVAERACTRHEIGLASTLAEAPDVQAAAWLRLWTKFLMLAFLTGHPLPEVPPTLGAGWTAWPNRLRECALAAVAERGVADRAVALRTCYPPAALARALTRAAAGLLDGCPAPRAAGQVWVLPQLRWAHEAARVGWRRGCEAAVPAGALAPPLDFALTGLPDWPGILAGERLRLLRRHPSSVEVRHNRELAATALFGEEGQAAFDAGLAADLAAVLPSRTDHPDSAIVHADRQGEPNAACLAEALRLMGCPGEWLLAALRRPASG